jgi:predicted Rossmann-fold nucleotide-binding protein
MFDIQPKPEVIKQVAFLGGAGWEPTDQAYLDAFETAKLLTQNGFEIFNGGGPGVMRAATLGAQAAGGDVIAITYHPNKPKRHYEGCGHIKHF